MDISQQIKFAAICKLFEKIKNAEGVKHKEIYLKRYIESFQERVSQLQLSDQVANTSFYCVLRCLIPNADTARESYGIQVTALGKIFVKILNLSPNSDDAQKLTYKNVTGEYADVVYGVMKSRAKADWSQLSLAEVHRILDVIAADDRKTTEKELISFVEATCAMEQKWFIRILLKKMHLGIGEQKMFSIFHPLAKEFYTRHTNLEKVCDFVEKGESISLDDTVAPFQHIRPMLCERLNVNKLPEILRLSTFFAETKMDGERFQLHLLNEQFMYISRNGRDYTKHFGQSPSEGNLTPVIAKQLSLNVKSIVLDGEMMVFDKTSSLFRVKGENVDVKHLPVGGNLRPCFVIYDMLYLNGKSLLESVYSERINLIQKNVDERVGILQICKPIKILTLSHFMDIFNNALKSNEEGIVIKRQMSKYKPGSRTGGWYKVKADYIEGVTSDFDLLIIGGFYNRSKTNIESFLVGVIKLDENENPRVYSVGKVAMGLSNSERQKLNKSLKKSWISSSIHCETLEFGATKPDVWLEPKNSVVLQIRASELFQNSSFRTPYALRFPRIEAIRNDKVWKECMSLDEFESFYVSNHGVKKVDKRMLNIDDFTVVKKQKTARTGKCNAYSSKFNPNQINKESDDLRGEQFCILSIFKLQKYSIDDIKSLVIKNGGTILENPLVNSQNCICVAGDITYKVEALKNTKLHNIVSLEWLIENFGEKSSIEPRTVQLRPRNMICTTSEMDGKFKQKFDVHGDSFTDHVNINELNILLDGISPNGEHTTNLLDILNLEKEIYNGQNSPNLFRNLSAHFHNFEVNDYRQNSAELIFKFRGGTCVEDINTSINNNISVIFCNPDASISETVNIHIGCPIVSIKWILYCDRNDKLLPMDMFLLRQ